MLLLVATARGDVEVWDINREQLSVQIDQTSPVSGVCFAPKGWVFALGSEDGSTRIFDGAAV